MLTRLNQTELLLCGLRTVFNVTAAPAGRNEAGPAFLLHPGNWSNARQGSSRLKQVSVKLCLEKEFSQGRQPGFGNSLMPMGGYRQARIKLESAMITVLHAFNISQLPVAMGQAWSFDTGGGQPEAALDHYIMLDYFQLPTMLSTCCGSAPQSKSSSHHPSPGKGDPNHETAAICRHPERVRACA